MCFFSSVSPGLEGTKIPSAVTVVDLKQHFPSMESAAAVESLRKEAEVFCPGLVTTMHQDFPWQGSQGPLEHRPCSKSLISFWI